MIVRPDGLTSDREFGHLVLRWWHPDRSESGSQPIARAAETRLEGSELTKAFEGLTAVDAVSIDLASGEIVGLIGPNGAGKTTLLNLISGVLPLTGGALALNGRSIAARSPRDIARAGIARTFQNIRLFEGMTVWENLDVADSTARRHRLRSESVRR